MAVIPSTINEVTIEFADAVNKDVTKELVDAMNHAIKKDVASGRTLTKLWVSSANDQHSCPSRHATGNGVDISRVNGKYLSTSYDSDGEVKEIVDSLQTAFEGAPKRRENFGPTIQKKEGVDHPVSGHTDHFHWSVNGDHSGCAGLLKRIWSFFFGNGRGRAEVCDK